MMQSGRPRPTDVRRRAAPLYNVKPQESKEMLNATTKGIDFLIEKQGQLTSFLIVPLLFIVLYEVLMRYAFNAPTVWGFEATAFAYGMHYMLGLSFMENAQGHVGWTSSPPAPVKAQAVVIIIGYLAHFHAGLRTDDLGRDQFAHTATITNELNSTSWAPRIWPYKIVMALSFFCSC
jgi:TRAP-type mannitol/chloroaromatic compound transport system permease small subunit